jgi:hypothetical protein
MPGFDMKFALESGVCCAAVGVLLYLPWRRRLARQAWMRHLENPEPGWR